MYVYVCIGCLLCSHLSSRHLSPATASLPSQPEAKASSSSASSASHVASYPKIHLSQPDSHPTATTQPFSKPQPESNSPSSSSTHTPLRQQLAFSRLQPEGWQNAEGSHIVLQLLKPKKTCSICKGPRHQTDSFSIAVHGESL